MANQQSELVPRLAQQRINNRSTNMNNYSLCFIILLVRALSAIVVIIDNGLISILTIAAIARHVRTYASISCIYEFHQGIAGKSAGASEINSE